MSDFCIREAKPRDFQAVLELWFSMEERHTALPDREEYLETMHKFAPDLFLVAEAKGKVVGTIVGGWDGWRGHMARLAISPESRRSRIAHALVREVEERLRAKGARRIYALVDRRNELGKSFWSAVGYAPSEDIVQYSKNLEDGGAG